MFTYCRCWQVGLKGHTQPCDPEFPQWVGRGYFKIVFAPSWQSVPQAWHLARKPVPLGTAAEQHSKQRVPESSCCPVPTWAHAHPTAGEWQGYEQWEPVSHEVRPDGVSTAGGNWNHCWFPVLPCMIWTFLCFKVNFYFSKVIGINNFRKSVYTLQWEIGTAFLTFMLRRVFFLLSSPLLF